MAAPLPTQTAFSQDERFDALDLDRESGAIRDEAHAFSKDGGLAVLYGNLAVDGGVVKQSAVEKEALVFTGKAKVFNS